MNFIFDEQALLKHSAIWNMPSFLEIYTLHESSLYEFRVRSISLEDERFDLKAYQNEHSGFQVPMMDVSLTRTVFEFMNWGGCQILHSADVSFACFDESGNLGEIPFENKACEKS